MKTWNATEQKTRICVNIQQIIQLYKRKYLRFITTNISYLRSLNNPRKQPTFSGLHKYLFDHGMGRFSECEHHDHYQPTEYPDYN